MAVLGGISMSPPWPPGVAEALSPPRLPELGWELRRLSPEATRVVDAWTHVQANAENQPPKGGPKCRGWALLHCSNLSFPCL